MADISKIKLPDGVTYNIKDANKTDEKVAQIPNDEDADYRVLLSNGATNVAQTDSVKKSDTLTYNPYYTNLNIKSPYVGENMGVKISHTNVTCYDWRGESREQVAIYSDGIRCWDNNIVFYNSSITPGQTIYLDGLTGNITCNSMSVTDISSQYTITKSSGSWTLNSFIAYRTGNVIQIQLNFRGGGSSVSGGTTTFQGKITAGPIPVMVSSGARASTNHNAIATLTSEGNITVVNTGDNWNLSTSSNLGIPVVFITA